MANNITVNKEKNNTLVVQQSTENKVTVSSAVFQNTGGVSLWGNISGDITNQTDLIEYLDRPVQTIDIESEDGSVFTIAVTNAGVLIVIPEGSTEPVITSPPVIIGTEKVWYTLGAIAGGVTGSPAPERTWQWQRSTNGLTWTDITGANGATYTLVAEDAGKYIRVQQTETNVLDSVTANSAATGLIADSVFSTTTYANITPITWENITQTWN